MGRALGGLVPRDRSGTDPGHLRGVHRHRERRRSAACSTPSGSIRPEVEGQKGPMKRQADDLSWDWVTRFRDDNAERQFTA